ncbi:MAG: TOBE-like domain-containing protein [Candidatus Omnitrophica bacterium]|nr:TOBE-like domain-containing protein [Candidatus Omnitrophota bacterium]
MYVRPHQLAVSRIPVSENSVKITIEFINPAGSSVKIDGRSSTGNVFQVEISQEEYKNLKLAKNDEIYLTPKNITYSEYEI